MPRLGSRVLGCTLLLASIIGCGSSKNNAHASTETGTEAVAGVTTFTDTSLGLRLTYPGDWEPMDVDKEDAILVLARLHDHAGLTMPPTVTLFAQPPQTEPQARDLDVLEDDFIRKARGGVKKFNLVEQAQTTLGGEPARRIVYTGSMLRLNVKVFNVITVHHGRPYAMMYLADPKRYDVGAGDVQRMVESWEWVR